MGTGTLSKNVRDQFVNSQRMKEQWAEREPVRQTGDRPLQSWPLAGDELSSPTGKALLTQV